MKPIQKLPAGEGGELGGFTVRRFPRAYPQGEKPAHSGHKHWINHLTYIERGSFKISADDGSSVLARAGDYVLIRAQNKHEIWPLEARSAWSCMFAEAEALKWMEQENINRALAKLKEKGVPETDDAYIGLASMVLKETGVDDILSSDRIANYARARID